MPGRVKHRHARLKHKPTPPEHTKLLERMADTDQTGTDFDLHSSLGHGEPILSKQAIAWIVIVTVIVITAFIIISWLLCRCKRRKKSKVKRHSNGHRHHPSLEVTDGRNEHLAWNKNAKPRKTDTDESGFSLTPLSKGGVAPAGTVHPGEPVVVDEVPSSPVYPTRHNRGKYYSGLGSVWQRVSQIGRAY